MTVIVGSERLGRAKVERPCNGRIAFALDSGPKNKTDQSFRSLSLLSPIVTSAGDDLAQRLYAPPKRIPGKPQNWKCVCPTGLIVVCIQAAYTIKLTI